MLDDGTRTKLVLALGDEIRENRVLKDEVDRLEKTNADLRDQLRHKKDFWVGAYIYYDRSMLETLENSDDILSRLKADLLEKKLAHELLHALLPYMEVRWSQKHSPTDPPYADKIEVRARIKILPAKRES